MAVDIDRNKVALSRINEFENRVNKAEVDLADIFKTYNIPNDVTDYNTKLKYALSEIGDDVAARDELKKKFADAQKAYEDRSKSIKEDFVDMVQIFNENLEKIDKEIKAEEEILKRDEAEKVEKEDRLKVIDLEIKALDEDKLRIGGADGENGQVGEEKAKSAALKKEQTNITKEIQKIEAEILKIDQEIAKLNEAMKNAKSQDEINKCSEDIAALEGKKSKFVSDKGELANQFQDKENLKREVEENIRNLKLEYSNKDSEISTKSTEKNKLESELRLLPSRGPELEKIKKEFESQKEEYQKAISKMQKLLADKGIDVKVEEGEKGKDKDKQTEKDSSKEGKSQSNGGSYGPAGGPSQTQTLPVIKPEDKNKANLEYITGYSSDGVGLSSEDRLKRIQSDLGGRDYEAMVKALTELKKSPVKLTKEDKYKIKDMMQTDKKNLAQTIKDLDTDKLVDLFKSVGINMSPKELKNLNYYSFDQKDKDSEEYGNAGYGILDGFSNMSSDSKSKWEDVVKAYSKNKGNMSETEIKDFEKYVMTPLKFGTLHEQSKELYRNPISKAWSNFVVQLNGGTRSVEDIRSAIAEVELPEGEDIASRSKAKNFTETLRSQTQKEPKDTEYPPKTGEEKSR